MIPIFYDPDFAEELSAKYSQNGGADRHANRLRTEWLCAGSRDSLGFLHPTL
jgi:hypothetical protein